MVSGPVRAGIIGGVVYATFMHLWDRGFFGGFFGWLFKWVLILTPIFMITHYGIEFNHYVRGYSTDHLNVEVIESSGGSKSNWAVTRVKVTNISPDKTYYGFRATCAGDEDFTMDEGIDGGVLKPKTTSYVSDETFYNIAPGPCVVQSVDTVVGW